MAYPPGGSWSINEVLGILAKHHISLCYSTRTQLARTDGTEVVPAVYLHGPGHTPFGISPPKSGNDEVTWGQIHAIGLHFNIEPEEFGLTAGWPIPWL